MDEEMYQQLLAMLQAQYAQEGGGYVQADPFAPQGGFAAQPMPNGKMPQYRTQGSGYVSDGTVRDNLNKVLPNQGDFSADALFQAPPELKALISRAVAEGGHDPYAVFATLDSDPYHAALADMAVRAAGDTRGFDAAKLPGAVADANDPSIVKIDSNGDGVGDRGWTMDDVLAQVQKEMAGQQVNVDNDFGFTGADGHVLQRRMGAADAYQQAINGYMTGLDDFVTQASPSMERNLNDMDFAWERLGGMPYRGSGGGSLDYADSGPGFARGAQAQSPGFTGAGARFQQGPPPGSQQDLSDGQFRTELFKALLQDRYASQAGRTAAPRPSAASGARPKRIGTGPNYRLPNGF